MSKCIKCGRCVEVCQEVQTIRAINTSHRSIDYEICTPYDQALEEGPCIFCGQCAEVCPVGAIYEHDDTDGVRAALYNSERCVIAQFSPSACRALNSELDLPPNVITSGKIVTALKMMGFKVVFDAGYFADLTIMEQGRELLDRIKNSSAKSKLPMISGCSSGLIKFIKDSYGGLTDHLSTGKSPQQNFGAFVKANYPQVSGMDSSKITTVSFVSCIAKKHEASLSSDVDFALTIRELAGMIRLAGIDFCNLSESPYDCVKSDSLTGAFDNEIESGGVMGTLLRWVYEACTGETIAPACFKESQKGIKETEVDLNGTKVKVLLINGLANARIVLDDIRRGECDAAFVEIMNCNACSAGDDCCAADAANGT